MSQCCLVSCPWYSFYGRPAGYTVYVVQNADGTPPRASYGRPRPVGEYTPIFGGQLGYRTAEDLEMASSVTTAASAVRAQVNGVVDKGLKGAVQGGGAGAVDLPDYSDSDFVTEPRTRGRGRGNVPVPPPGGSGTTAPLS